MENGGSGFTGQKILPAGRVKCQNGKALEKNRKDQVPNPYFFFNFYFLLIYSQSVSASVDRVLNWIKFTLPALL